MNYFNGVFFFCFVLKIHLCQVQIGAFWCLLQSRKSGHSIKYSGDVWNARRFKVQFRYYILSIYLVKTGIVNSS